MQRIQQLMKLHRLMEPAGDNGSDTGGTGSGTGDAGTSATGDTGAAATSTGATDPLAGQPKKPTDDEAKLLKDVMKHKTRASELEAQLSQVNEKLKQFEGIDAAKVRALLAEQERLETERLEKAGEYDRLLKQMAERHTQEKTALQQEKEAEAREKAALQGQIAELTVGNSFASSKFVQEDLTLTPTKARVIYGSHFEFKDGQVVGYDKPAGAKDRTMLVSSTGEPLAFEDAMKRIIEADPDRDHLIRSKMKPGASSSTSTKGSKKAESERATQLSSVERIAAGLKALAPAK